ncbi:MAG: glycosyltransferase family 2 protein [Ruminococcus flavefaciens]|nr:glycosyltransferase family 2 protein [Ruminococcus flavefaciens]
MMQPKTAVVILNWNGQKFLEQFFPLVVEHTCMPGVDVIVADNASTDASLAYLHDNFPQIKTVVNARNEGFAGGYNLALQKIQDEAVAQGEPYRYFVLLNSDIEVTPHWVEPVLAAMEADATVAAAQPKLLAYHDKGLFEYAGAAGGFIDRLGYPFCRGRIFDTVETDRGQYDTPCQLLWATGAALFVRADLYLQHGGLDADFFAHMEEIDFCWRMRNLGYKVMYEPASVLYHVGGGTLPKTSSRKTYLNFRNNLSLLYKNLPQDRLRKVLFARWFLDRLAALAFLLKGEKENCKAVFQARKDFRKIKEDNKKKRRSLPQRPDLTGLYNRSILWQYHLKKKRFFSDLPDCKVV